MKKCILIAPLFLIALQSFAVPPTITSFSPGAGCSGMTITITGTNFTGTSAVSFGGTAAAAFAVVSSTQITAVIGFGGSGSVQVTNSDGSATKAGLTYVPTSGIITDFGGYWSATGASPNSIVPDNSHNLLAVTYGGTTYSTGVNDAVLSSNGVSFSAGNFKALPVAGIAGTTGATSTYLALAKKVDGSANVAKTTAVANYSIKTVLTDGAGGLNMGTGVTNLPASAILTFQIYNINTAAITDAEPDILLTQIAQPVAGNDVFSFIDALGAIVGNAITQDMTSLPRLGNYDLDLFNLTPNTPYNSAKAYSAFSTNTNREIRLAGFRLSDFGITAANVSLVKALKITPSGNSDYAFIAYNANSINLPPNISSNDAETNANICSGGTANLAVVATAAAGGALSYMWEQSADGGTTWTTVADAGIFSGATTPKLTITGASNGYKYRATVHEVNNGNAGISAAFVIAVGSAAAPSSVSVGGTGSTCLNNAVQLSSSVTGGSNLYYQWQSNSTGTYVDIPNAGMSTYTPPVDQTGVISYKLKVSSGSGCPFVVSSTAVTLTVTGIAATTPASACSSGAVTLNATATSGTIDWYDVDAGGASLAGTNSFITPTLYATKTYYVASAVCPAALRVPVTATIYPASAGGAISGSTTVITGTNSTTLTLAGNTGNVTKWQSSTDGFAAVINDIANTGYQHTATNLTQTTAYRAATQSGTCAVSFSAAATITVTGTLPIDDRTITAALQNNGVLLSWTASAQELTQRYEIERSANGTDFKKAGTVIPTNRGRDAIAYSWLDTAPLEGTDFYRIKEVLNTGHFNYSKIVKVFFEKKAGIAVYPNPVTNGKIQVQFLHAPAGRYAIELFNSLGQSVSNTLFSFNGGIASTTVALTRDIKAGVYTLKITGSNAIIKMCRVVVL